MLIYHIVKTIYLGLPSWVLLFSITTFEVIVSVTPHNAKHFHYFHPFFWLASSPSSFKYPFNLSYKRLFLALYKGARTSLNNIHWFCFPLIAVTFRFLLMRSFPVTAFLVTINIRVHYSCMNFSFFTFLSLANIHSMKHFRHNCCLYKRSFNLRGIQTITDHLQAVSTANVLG